MSVLGWRPIPVGMFKFEDVFVGNYDQLVELSRLRLATQRGGSMVDYHEAFRRFYLKEIAHVGHSSLRTRAPLEFSWKLDWPIAYTDTTAEFELLCATLSRALSAPTEGSWLRECSRIVKEATRLRPRRPIEDHELSDAKPTLADALEADTSVNVGQRRYEPIVMWAPLYDALRQCDLANVPDDASPTVLFTAAERYRQAQMIMPTNQLIDQRRQRTLANAWMATAKTVLTDHGRAGLAVACARVAADEDARWKDECERMIKENEEIYHDALVPRQSITLRFDPHSSKVIIDDTIITIGLLIIPQ